MSHEANCCIASTYSLKKTCRLLSQPLTLNHTVFFSVRLGDTFLLDQYNLLQEMYEGKKGTIKIDSSECFDSSQKLRRI